MDMADYSKLGMENSCQVCGSEEKMEKDGQKISVSDNINGFQYTADNSDSFVIDMESVSRGTNKDATPNSRITRNLSRKGPQRGGQKKISPSGSPNNKDTVVATSSPRAAMLGSSTPKSPVLAVGTMDNASSPQVHHQITITTGNITTSTESKGITRRNSFRRSPWALDPKKMLLFFATLSSVGTILLIYLTLSIGKVNAEEDGLDWQQRP